MVLENGDPKEAGNILSNAEVGPDEMCRPKTNDHGRIPNDNNRRRNGSNNCCCKRQEGLCQENFRGYSINCAQGLPHFPISR